MSRSSVGNDDVVEGFDREGKPYLYKKPDIFKKSELALKALGEAFAKGEIHGCGSIGCCLEFEIKKGAASNFHIKRKKNRPYLDYKEFLRRQAKEGVVEMKGKGKRGKKGC